MRRYADAIDRSQGAVHDSDDLGDGYPRGRLGQVIAAVWPFLAPEVAGPFEEEQDLFKEALGNVLGCGNVADMHRAVRMVEGELEHSPAGVFTFGR